MSKYLSSFSNEDIHETELHKHTHTVTLNMQHVNTVNVAFPLIGYNITTHSSQRRVGKHTSLISD